MHNLNSPSSVSSSTSGSDNISSPYTQQQPTNPYSRASANSSPYHQQGTTTASSPYQQGTSPYHQSSSSPYQQSSSPYQQQPNEQYGGYNGGNSGGYAGSAGSAGSSMRRRQPTTPTYGGGGGGGYSSSPYGGGNGEGIGSSPRYQSKYSSKSNTPAGSMSTLKSFDMFPKIETDLTVQTSRGGIVSLAMYGIIVVLLITEMSSYIKSNSETNEHVVVDTALNKRMRINLNITFPGLACEDLHINAMDVAGDSQLDLEDTFTKVRYRESGRRVEQSEIEAEVNAKFKADAEKQAILKQKLPENYCGPCYGAVEEDEKETKCCQTCDELIEAYKERRWSYDGMISAAEQCVREGVHARKPKLMKKGEGCNIAGFMRVNRVNGNFHVAMGEGVERDGRHIQLFNPEDTINFNSSHVIHELSFGEENQKDMEEGRSVLDGVQKIVTEKSGGTGLFHYFVKVVPTVYKDRKGPQRETNRFFFTERFRPLYTDLDEEHYNLGEKRKYADDTTKKKDGIYDEYEYIYHYDGEEFFGHDDDDDDDDLDDDDDSGNDDPDHVVHKIKQTFASGLSKEGNEEANTGINFGKNPKTAEKEKKQQDEKQKAKEDVTAANEKKTQEDMKKEEEEGKNDKMHAGVKIGQSQGSNSAKDHHKVQNAVLPGVFVIYEVYPFAVEISTNSVPLTHLIVRFMAIIGGAVTITGLLDKFLYAQDLNRKGNGSGGFR